jgi:uncharacterized protein (DUF1800 family)
VLFFVPLAAFAPYLETAKGARSPAPDSSTSSILRGIPASGVTADQAIVHALNRLGYGPRPGEVERVRQMGLAAWIDRQLHPESIDDSALAARLAKYPTLTMSSAQLLEDFPPLRVAAQRAGMTLEEYRQQQQSRMRELRRQIAAAGHRPGDPLGSQDSPGKLATAYQSIHSPQRIVAELAMARMDRAVYSDRQLYEQMVNFWLNHFNVYANKGADRWLLTSFERDAIRPHAMGKFRDLLEATAKSPAMLFYLDNWQSADPQASARLQQELDQRRRRFAMIYGGPFGMGRSIPRRAPNPGANRQQNKQRQPRGINENYGRELMELHTLGVDGGYTQQDVIEVANCLTGWTIRAPRRDPQFWFDNRIHDPRPKMVLGHKIHAGGIRDGEEVLDLLARDPHTAHHLSLEIARHFVSDNPPPALVDRMEQTYLSTDGDIRAVLHTMIFSPEFWSRDAIRAKIKTPFELVASAARAVGAQVDLPLALVQWTGRIGEPLYLCQPPNGYPDQADAWVNTGALLNRLNYSIALTGNRLVGVHVDMAALLGSGAAADPRETLDRAIAVLLSGEVSPGTRRTLEQQLNTPEILQARLDDPVKQINQGLIAGLVLGAPEFQRR